MGRNSKITVFEECERPGLRTNRNLLYKILSMKTPSRAKTIAERFEAYTGCPFEFNSITMVNLSLFKERCFEDLAPNTIATICGWMAATVRIVAPDFGKNPEKLCSILTSPRERGTFAWVNQEEVDKIIEYYRTATGVKRSVAALAILEFYTAARKSDTTLFDGSNITSQNYIDKESKQLKTAYMITYTSRKTSIKASVPTKPIVEEILNDNLLDLQSVDTSTFNYHIKQIAIELNLDRKVSEHRAGVDIKDRPLYECISSHSFRRSFATVLKNKGVSVDTIAQMMGHTNTQQTSRYIQSDTLVLDDNALKFFK